MPDKPNDNKESWISRLRGTMIYMCNIHTAIELPDALPARLKWLRQREDRLLGSWLCMGLGRF